jgi:hypothetical protein
MARPSTVAPADSAAAPRASRSEPVFEQISQERITAQNEMPNAPEHFNEYGLRKFDFPAALQRLRAFFTGPNTSNPKLVNYLAAGGVHGLRPLRKEKRVARNRFIFFRGRALRPVVRDAVGLSASALRLAMSGAPHSNPG